MRVQRSYISPGGELRTTLTFADYKPFSVTASGLSANKYACNSLYDPDITGVGNQPHDFDQYAALYGRYEVMSSSIEVEFAMGRDLSNVVSTYYPMIGGILMHNALGTIPSNVYELMSAFNTKTALIGTDGAPAKITEYFTPKNVLGFVGKDDVLTAGVTANPSQQAEWYVFVANNGNPAIQPVGVKIKIRYNVRFFGKKENTGS